MRILTTAFVAMLLAFPGSVRAGNLTFTETFVADFEFSLLGHTAINPGDTTPFIPFQAVGNLTFTLDASIDDPTATTVPFVNVTGSLAGDNHSPPQFLPYVISPNVEFIGGELTNIVRVGGGAVVSADVSNLSMRWNMVGTPANITLFTQDGLPFDATGVTVPFATGTVLSGAAEFNVYLDDGGSNPLVVIGRNRTLTAVPEPGSAILAGLAVLASAAVSARRRSRIRSL